MKELIILSCILMHGLALFSNVRGDIRFHQINTNKGLSQNTVRAIIEDKKGFIWAATLGGLNKYDGYKFVTFLPELGNPYSLIDHQIKDVHLDRDGYIWIKTYDNEFCCYDPYKDLFYSKNRIRLHNNQSLYYTDYYEAENGDIWLWGNINGCVQIIKRGQSFVTNQFFTEPKIDCTFLFEDSKSTVWIGGDGCVLGIKDGREFTSYKKNNTFINAVEQKNKIYFITDERFIIEYDISKETFNEIDTQFYDLFTDIAVISDSELLIITENNKLLNYNVRNKQLEISPWMNDKDMQRGNINLITDKNGGLWLYNHSGYMWYYNISNQKLKKLPLIPNDILKSIDLERYNVFIDSKNYIWITTYGNGIFLYEPDSENLQHFKYSSNKNSPASDYLLSITEDRNGNIWIGSEYAGIIKVVESDYHVQTIKPEEESSVGKNNNVRSIYEDNFNNIWFGTKNGNLYLYDNDLRTGKSIYEDINPYAITQDASNRLWVGTKGKGLYIIDPQTKKQLCHFSVHQTADAIFCIMKDHKDRMWLGSFGKGLILTEETLEGIHFKYFFHNEGNRSYIRCILQDSNGIFWVGSRDGILRFDPDKLINDPQAYTVNKMNLFDGQNGLNCNDIKTILEDSEGTIWIGTAGGGLNKYIPPTQIEEESFKAYTVEDGLSGNFITGILEDENNNLWISTESGITKFDKGNQSSMIYQFAEKSHGNQYNENANIYSTNKYMLWGSLNGLLYFNPELFVPGTNVCAVTLTGFYVNNQSLSRNTRNPSVKTAISYATDIKLNHKENSIRIEFAALDLKDSPNNKYTYMLTGYDKTWSIVSSANIADYKNLPPGKYQFLVRGTNSSGIWNEEVTSLNIEITPPIWASWYAYMVYILIALTIVYIVIRLIRKFNKLNNNIEIEKELTNHKLRFFTNISHEFRTPLTLIRGTVENLNSLNDTPEPIRQQLNVLDRNSTILTRLIDQLLEFRKLQNNVLTLDLEEKDIVEFSKEIFNNFQIAAAQKNIRYTFYCEENQFKMFIDSRKVDKIIYNLLSNAFKYTPRGGEIELALKFNPTQETCLISVKDTGIGIPKEKQHILFSSFMQINFSSEGTGIGLSLVKEFVEVHKGRIWYESNQDQGSLFNVELSTNAKIYEGENFVTPLHHDILPSECDNNELSLSGPITENIRLPEIDDITLSNYKLLIIDDNDDIRNFLVDEFSKYFMVDTAEEGKSGLEKAIQTNPDMIICDVMMPEMNGFEVTRKLKEEFQTCHIPIIMLTAHSSLDHQVEGIQSGADAYITKPFSIKYLVTRVFKLIEQREQLKKRFSKNHVFDGNLITSTDQDKKFLELIDRILEEHLSNTLFSVDKFAELAKQSRTVFYKKVKGITGMSPNELIKIKRLNRAARYLLEEDLTVAEVSYKVGFEDPFYFSKCFKTHFNCSPSKYGQMIVEEQKTAPNK